MAIHRTRKQKEMPHYGFLVTWKPPEAHVKRELDSGASVKMPKLSASKKAYIQAKDGSLGRIKKDIVRSLMLISFMLILEVVVYLAWSRFR